MTDEKMTVEQALNYLLMRDRKLANYISMAAGKSMTFSENLVKQIAGKLTVEMKKSVVETAQRETHLKDLITLQQRMLQKFNSNLSDLEDHVSDLRKENEWNKVCDELHRPDLKRVYV